MSHSNSRHTRIHAQDRRALSRQYLDVVDNAAMHHDDALGIKRTDQAVLRHLRSIGRRQASALYIALTHQHKFAIL